MLETICTGCQFGEHDCCQGGQKPPEGMLGGWHCRCKGECVDGRYVPPQFKNLEKAIKQFSQNEGASFWPTPPSCDAR